MLDHLELAGDVGVEANEKQAARLILPVACFGAGSGRS